MEKLPICRICLAENVRMHIVVNRNLHELYEKLTDIPFVTEDSRPILACFFCYAKLKHCHQLLRQCLKAEELFAQRMNEDYEPNPLINQEHLEFCSGFIKSRIVHLSIVDECQSIAIKKELPADCEGPDDFIELKEEHQSDEIEPENLDNSCHNVADIHPHHSESDLEDDAPLLEFKIEVEEEEVPTKKRRASDTKKTAVAKKPKLDTRRTKLEEEITAELMKKGKSASKVIRTTQKRTSKSDTYIKDPFKSDHRSFNRVKKMIQHARTQIGKKPNCDVCQRSFSHNGDLIKHIRIHTGEKPYECDVCRRSFSRIGNLTKHIRIHTGEKPYKCGICQRGFIEKGNLTKHIRIHTGEKPYNCDVCQRSFGHKSDLTKHVRIHTGEKPYECDVCRRSFSRIGHLTKHIRIHTGEKAYKCNVCHCSFSLKRNLTAHFRIHTGKKPYSTAEISWRV